MTVGLMKNPPAQRPDGREDVERIQQQRLEAGEEGNARQDFQHLE